MTKIKSAKKSLPTQCPHGGNINVSHQRENSSSPWVSPGGEQGPLLQRREIAGQGGARWIWRSLYRRRQQVVYLVPPR